MNNQSSLQLPVNVMTSPMQAPLRLALFKSAEGIERRGVTTYEGILTFEELASHFQIEANSDVLNEALKKQRDVDNSRIKALKHYWGTSEGPVFPSMTIFSNDLIVNSQHSIAGREIVEACLAPEFDRFICDGQGRTTFIKWLLEQAISEEAHVYTIGFKLIVTHSESLSTPKASEIIKQVFADYHVSLKKPNKSISKHFDSSTPLARLLNQLLDIDVSGPIRSRIATHGHLRRGHLWTYEQFSSMIQKFLQLTSANQAKQLGDEEKYQAALDLCTQFLERVFTILPVTMLDSDNYAEQHESAMFTKAIFASALGYVGRSLFDEILTDEGCTWDKLATLAMPITSKNDKFWQKNKVTMEHDGAIKIVKATDRKIGALICRELRILPCSELTA